MPVRWRELLDSLNVAWSDQPSKAARGWIAIHCPWCRDDPSEHLGINEEFGHYYCLRNEQHKGRSPYWLLKGLGVHPRDVDDLLHTYGAGTRRSAARTERSATNEYPPLVHRWQSFTSAAGHPDALAYLHRRHFPDPERTVKEFDLRVGTGRWARRVWFGLSDLAGTVNGFTGRAIDDWLQPRYYTQTPEACLYFPKTPNHNHRLALIVEGPMDALRTADAVQRRRNLLVIALCGLSTTGNRRWQLTQLAKLIPSFAVTLDASVPPPRREQLMNELRAIPALGRITRLRLPPTGADDPGELTNREVERWLSTM